MSAGNGFRNLGSHDMDKSKDELKKYLTDDPEENERCALKFTRAILLSRLFILSKVLRHKSNITPRHWLLIQLLPIQVTKEDFWVPISRVFRGLEEEVQDELISEFINNLQPLIPIPQQAERLPIVIDEAQTAISLYKDRFSSSQPGQLRPFFAILLRTVLNLSTGKLCLVLSGTGMNFEDIRIHTSSAIAKSGGATYKNFFSMHNGFYGYEEMKKFIRRFLPLDDKLIGATFKIFRGRRRFVVQFLEHALKDSSSTSQSNMDEIVKEWQDKARYFIIGTFMESCFPRLHEKKEAWNKMRDIVILSLFSHDAILMKGDGVSQMVQYGFAQLDNIRHLADINTLDENAITVRIAEPIPIFAFREYLNKHPNELEAQLYQNLNSVHYNAVCAGFLFEPCLTIHLAELFNGKICKDHILFKNIDNINKLDLLLSCKTTIRNLDDCNVTTLCSEGSMEKENLPAFLENPTTAFFKPESEAGPDLVFIVQFHTLNGIIEIPIFLQAKLVKNKPGTTAKDTTNPNYFYAHDGPTPELKIELRKKVLNCLRSKYCKAHELSWIRFLVVFPSEAREESEYIESNPRPKRAVAPNFNDLTGIIISFV